MLQFIGRWPPSTHLNWTAPKRQVSLCVWADGMNVVPHCVAPDVGFEEDNPVQVSLQLSGPQSHYTQETAHPIL